MRALRAVTAAVAVLAVTAPAADACVQVGVYQDSPAARLPALQRQAPGLRWLSTYLTAGDALDPKLVKLANARKVGLVVSWLPDNGRDGATQPKYRLKNVAKGKYDATLRALGRTLRGVRKGAVVRPMPEPNTPWYAWSGTVNGNKPADYVTAFKRVRKAVRKGGGARVKLLWSPYARSVPETGANAISAYFPGAKQVDLVGATAYNFGSVADLKWIQPMDLFSEAYATIEALAAKPFWISETGSVAAGGDRGAWIGALGSLSRQLPKLKAVVWFDVKDRTGDFRLAGKPTLRALKALTKGRCA